MPTFRRQMLMAGFKMLDLINMTIAFSLSTALFHYRFDIDALRSFLSVRVKIENFIIFLGLLITWHIIFSSFGLYQSRRLSSRLNEVFDVIKSVSLGTLAIALAGLSFHIELITPAFLVSFWALANLTIIVARLVVRYLLRKIRIHGRNQRYILIIGTNERCLRLVEYIEHRPELGYQILGFADDEWQGSHEFQGMRYRIVSTLDGIQKFIDENVVDEVIIGLPVKSFYDKGHQIVEHCREQGIIVRVPMNMFDLKPPQTHTLDLEGQSVLSYNTGRINGVSSTMKRVIDILISSLLLVLLFPLFLLIALLIKITSPGPIFYVDVRIGLNKRPFRMLKFRSMVKDADKIIDELSHLNVESGPAFKIRNDPRITKFGWILRKTSLDELPQLINVLKGDMSLVGPRPLFTWEFQRIKDAWIKRRFSVKPGMTGLWQVSGRSEANFDIRIQMDLDYIDNWTLLLDLWLLVRTIPVVVLGKGAE